MPTRTEAAATQATRLTTIMFLGLTKPPMRALTMRPAMKPPL
jgi:hypothetical protein